MDILKMSKIEKGPSTFFRKNEKIDFAVKCSKTQKNTFFQQCINFFCYFFGVKYATFFISIIYKNGNRTNYKLTLQI